MLAKRIVPTMLIKGRTLVKGQKFDSWRSIGHALQGAKVHGRRQVDELLILDIAATAEGRGPDLEMVRDLTSEVFIPITVGGGVRSLKDIDALLRAGADKVAIGTAAVETPDLIREASAHFGRQAIVVSVDATADWQITRRCGKERLIYSAKKFAQGCADMGAGEILLSSIDRDGTMEGYDLALIREVSQAVDVPVIASGGCRDYDDMLNAFKAGADACAAGALWAFGDETPRGAAQYLAKHGLTVRVP